MAKAKPYVAKSLNSAQREVRFLRKINAKTVELLERYAKERRLMAMLAAEGASFDNPLVVAQAKALRNQILRDECRLKPDGSFIT